MIVTPETAPTSEQKGLFTRHLSAVPGGLTQFGCYLDTLDPGAWSSFRHWHSAEDEFLFVLSGTVTLRDDDGETDLFPGDAVCWPYGDPNAHHLTNRGDTPCRYLVAGSRVQGDICTYPDDHRRQINTATRWQIVTDDGVVQKEGDLPEELVGLPPLWGTPVTTTPQRILRGGARKWVHETGPTHPVLGRSLGDYHHSVLGDPGGLSQFGVHLEELPPGSASSFRHWHQTEDEMIYALSGFPTLVEDTETRLKPGDMVVWPAGTPIAHHLQNRTPEPAVYLTLGTRLSRDVITYPDHDLITIKDGSARHYTHADGRPRPKGERK